MAIWVLLAPLPATTVRWIWPDAVPSSGPASSGEVSSHRPHPWRQGPGGGRGRESTRSTKRTPSRAAAGEMILTVRHHNLTSGQWAVTSYELDVSRSTR